MNGIPQTIRKPAIYARVSSDEQVSGTSLDDQIDKCLKQAAVYGWVIPPERIYVDDGYSGASLDRPALTRLREAVRAGEVDFVMVYKLDRLSRNIKDTVNLILEEWSKEHKIVFRSVTEDFNTDSPLGTLIFSILASFAQFERDVIRERTDNGRQRRFKEGRRPVGKPPFGYDPGDIPGTMVVNEEEAKVVRRIFDMYLSGYGFMQISNCLNTEGIKTKQGKLWTDKTVRDILINEIYVGKVKYGGRVGQGNHQPIIDQETFAAAQELRRSKGKIGGRQLGSSFLLSGVVYCAKCGHTMYTQPATVAKRRHKDGSVYYTHNLAYYACGGRMKKGKSFCQAGYIPQRLLDSTVVERLKRRFLPEILNSEYLEEVEAEKRKQVSRLQGHLSSVQAEIEQRRKAIERWIRSFESGRLSPEKFAGRVNQLEQEIQQLETQEQSIKDALASATKQVTDAAWLEQVRKVLKRWDILPFMYQKHIVRCLVDKILVWKSSKGKGRFGEQAEIEIDITWNRSHEVPSFSEPELLVVETTAGSGE